MHTLSIYNYASYPKSEYVYTGYMGKFPNNLRHYREQAGLSQERLGDMVNRTKDAISKWERGIRKLNIPQARKLADALGINPGQLADDLNEELKPKSEIDEALLRECISEVQRGAKVQKLRLPAEDVISLAVKSYNHIMQNRKRGSPLSEASVAAAIVLQQERA